MEISVVTKKEAKQIVSEYHYLGDKGFRSSVAYGLFDGGVLSGVCIFHGLSAPETAVGAFGMERTDQTGFFELGRLVMNPRLNGGNHTSWFVSRCLKMLCKDVCARAVISYADTSAGHSGSIYKACNALYCGVTNKKSDFWVNGKIQERGKTRGVLGEWRTRPLKHRYMWVFDRTLRVRWPVVSYNAHGTPPWLRKCFSTE